MKNKLTNPVEVLPGKNYSLWTDMRVNGWGLAFLTDLFLHPSLQLHEEAWPIPVRITIQLLPALFLWLWVRRVARWIRGMDELQRGITLEACLFATTGTLISVAVWHRLYKSGILEAILQPPSTPLGTWDFRQLAHLDLIYLPLTVSIFCCFWGLGIFIFNRRYQ